MPMYAKPTFITIAPPIVNTLRGRYTDIDTQSQIPTLQTKAILRNQERLLANNIVCNAVIHSNIICNCGIIFIHCPTWRVDVNTITLLMHSTVYFCIIRFITMIIYDSVPGF